MTYPVSKLRESYMINSKERVETAEKVQKIASLRRIS